MSSISPNLIRTIKSRGIKWMGHVAGTANRRIGYTVLVHKI